MFLNSKIIIRREELNKRKEQKNHERKRKTHVLTLKNLRLGSVGRTIKKCWPSILTPFVCFFLGFILSSRLIKE